jgi:hypothetical protein
MDLGEVTYDSQSDHFGVKETIAVVTPLTCQSQEEECSHHDFPQSSVEIPPGVVLPPLKEKIPRVVADVQTSRREDIRRKLRMKEQALLKLISQREIQEFSDNSSIEDEANAQNETGLVLEGKDMADRREAIRNLSQAALHMKEKLRRQKEESELLVGEMKEVTNAIQERDGQRVPLENEIRRLRLENSTIQKQLEEMQVKLMAKKLFQQERNGIENAEFEDEDDCEAQISEAYRGFLNAYNSSSSKKDCIDYLEYHVLVKSHEIEMLKQELNATNHRLIELEVDYDFHDENILNVSDDTSRIDSVVATVNNVSKPNPKLKDDVSWLEEKKIGSVKKMFKWKRKGKKEACSAGSKSDLDDSTNVTSLESLNAELLSLSSRYKKDRFQSQAEINQLKKENSEYMLKVLSLERKLKCITPPNTPHENLSSDLYGQDRQQQPEQSLQASQIGEIPSQSAFLDKKIEQLEGIRDLQAVTIENLRCQIDHLQETARKLEERAQQVVNQGRLECQAKELMIAALERDISELRNDGSANRAVTLKHIKAANTLEDQLLESLSDVVKLRKALEVSDKKVSRLRAEVIDLRYTRMQYERASMNLKLSQEAPLHENPDSFDV